MYNVVTILAPSSFDRNVFILAANGDSHKILDGFEIPQDRTTGTAELHVAQPLSIWKNPHILIM